MEWAAMLVRRPREDILMPESPKALEPISPKSLRDVRASSEDEDSLLPAIFDFYRSLAENNQTGQETGSQELTDMFTLALDRGADAVNAKLLAKYGKDLSSVESESASRAIPATSESTETLSQPKLLSLAKFVIKRPFGPLSAMTKSYLELSDVSGTHMLRLHQEYMDLACTLDGTRIGTIKAELASLDGSNKRILALRDSEGRLIARYYEQNVSVLKYKRIVELPDRKLVCVVNRTSPSAYMLYVDEAKSQFALEYREKISSYKMFADASLPACALAMATLTL